MLTVARGTASNSTGITPTAKRIPTTAATNMIVAATILGTRSVFGSTGATNTERSCIEPHLSKVNRSIPGLPR